jgi:hypothetical protein
MSNDRCSHTVTQGRKGEKGSWCVKCGVKVYEVETRPCGDCKYCSELFRGFTCDHHRMIVSKQMFVTFKVSEGTCFNMK